MHTLCLVQAKITTTCSALPDTCRGLDYARSNGSVVAVGCGLQQSPSCSLLERHVAAAMQRPFHEIRDTIYALAGAAGFPLPDSSSAATGSVVDVTAAQTIREDPATVDRSSSISSRAGAATRAQQQTDAQQQRQLPRKHQPTPLQTKPLRLRKPSGELGQKQFKARHAELLAFMGGDFDGHCRQAFGLSDGRLDHLVPQLAYTVYSKNHPHAAHLCQVRIAMQALTPELVQVFIPDPDSQQ